MHVVLKRQGILAVAIALTLLSFGVRSSRADVTYTVTLDTSNYDSQGPFNIDFQLNDGSTGDGVGNNTATITNLTFVGAGSGLTGMASDSGSVSGDPTATMAANGLVITDNSFFNDFNQTFTPGTSLSFVLDLSTNVSDSESGDPLNPSGPGVPDEFSFTVNGNNFASTAAVLTIDITGNPPTISTDVGGSLNDGTITAAPGLGTPGAVPEPSTFALMGFGFVGLLGGGRWRRNAVTT